MINGTLDLYKKTGIHTDSIKITANLERVHLLYYRNITNLIKFAFKAKNITYMSDINRIKVALVESKKTSKWLAGQLGRNPATVSKWCTNTSQPDLQTLTKIAALLEMDLRDLLVSGVPEKSVLNN